MSAMECNPHNTHPSRGKESGTSGWLMILAVIIAVLGVVFVTNPPRFADSASARRTTAISNARSAYYLLINFDQDYNAFPNDHTADTYFDGKGKGEFSNDYLRQLALSGHTRSEYVFSAYMGSMPNKRPDGDIGTEFDGFKNFLAPGECGFAYIKNLSTSSPTEAPLLLAPMFGDGEKFNPEAYRGKAAVLHVNGSVQTYRIDDQLRAVHADGKSIFAGGAGSPWPAKGFDFSDLHYADSPYDFQPSTKTSYRVSIIVLAIIGIAALIFLARSAKRAR
ncbi:MAG: type II secretion system protein [Akkermansiaceae bacterium]